MNGMLRPNETLIPNVSATNPNSGGASKKTTKDICTREATLTADGRSVFWAAADIARGNITAFPAPIKVKPIKATSGDGEKVTQETPINIRKILYLAIGSAPYLSTY